MTESDHFLTRYVEHDTLIWEYLNSSIHLVWFHAQRSLSRNEPFSQAPYLEKKFKRIYQGDAYKYRVFDVFNFLAWKIILFRFYRLSDRLILNNALDTEMGSSDIDSAMRSFLCLCVLSCSVPLKVYRLCPHQVFPGDHWIYATASPLFGRASWRHRVWSSNLTWLKWSSNMTWLKLDTNLSPGRWHRRSWMLLMRKRSPASQSFPSSGVFLNPPAWYCNSLASYLTIYLFHIWRFIFSYLTFYFFIFDI